MGHVTKEGAIAGPRVLEHIVDTVLYFEGDTHSSFRLVRAIKNRFGAANELGVFAMTERGLKGVANPSALFLSQHGKAVPGSCVLATLEGSRPLLVEVQALVDPVQGALARRVAVGLDPQRLALLLAVLHRHGGVETAGQDVFVNAVGGVRIGEPAADLAISMAIYSSFKNIALDSKSLVFGEIGLAGEIRPVLRRAPAERRAALGPEARRRRAHAEQHVRPGLAQAGPAAQSGRCGPGDARQPPASRRHGNRRRRTDQRSARSPAGLTPLVRQALVCAAVDRAPRPKTFGAAKEPGRFLAAIETAAPRDHRTPIPTACLIR